MWHIIKYHSKSLLCNRSMIFWSLIFPLIMSTFFSLTLKNMSKGFEFETIPIAVVDDAAYQKNTALQEMLTQLAGGEKPYVEVKLATAAEAEALLKENAIDGYIQVKEKLVLNVNQSGMNQTILASIVTEYEQNQSRILRMLEEGATPDAIAAVCSELMTYIDREAEANTNLSCIYFFALMAMTMLFGGYWSMRTTDYQMADHSAIGARNTIAPTKRGMQLGIDFILSTFFNICVQIILLFYLIVILDIDFGNMIRAICIVVLAGSLAGNAIGVMVSAYGAKSYETNTGILTAINMLLCMLSGLMMVQIKYLIQEYLPIVAMLNPANWITDAFYAQYYYGMDARFFKNILFLLIFSGVCYILAYARLRRKTYANL